MSRLERQMRELRGLRDTAKGLVRQDVAFLKGENGAKGVAPRLLDRAGEGARDAAEYASAHKLKIGTGIALGLGAFAAWIFRDRIEDGFDRFLAHFSDEEAAGVEHDEADDNADIPNTHSE